MINANLFEKIFTMHVKELWGKSQKRFLECLEWLNANADKKVKPIIYAEWQVKEIHHRTSYKINRHWYWVEHITICSNCGERPLYDIPDDCADEVLSPYCPYCGATMREREEE